MQSEKNDHNRFNGHTWIVAIIAILAFLIIAILEIVFGFKIESNSHSLWMRIIVKGCVISVPLQMGVAIKSLMKRLTITEKIELEELKETKKLTWKQRFLGHK